MLQLQPDLPPTFFPTPIHLGTWKIHAWKIPWTEGPGRYSPRGCKESDTTERLHFHFSLSCIGEGNGNPLQCSCLENPKDGGGWWAAIYGVAQSRTQLKRLSSSSSSKLGFSCSSYSCRIFSCSMCDLFGNSKLQCVGSSFLTRDQT